MPWNSWASGRAGSIEKAPGRSWIGLNEGIGERWMDDRSGEVFSIQFCLHDGKECLHCPTGAHTLGFSFDYVIITWRCEEYRLTPREVSSKLLLLIPAWELSGFHTVCIQLLDGEWFGCKSAQTDGKPYMEIQADTFSESPAYLCVQNLCPKSSYIFSNVSWGLEHKRTIKYVFSMYSEGIPFAIMGWAVHLFHKVSLDTSTL